MSHGYKKLLMQTQIPLIVSRSRGRLTTVHPFTSDHICDFISSSVHCIFSGGINGLGSIGGMKPRMRMVTGLPFLSDYIQSRALRMMIWRRDILREKGLICIFIYLKYCHFKEGIKVSLESLEKRIKVKKILQGVRYSSIRGGTIFHFGLSLTGHSFTRQTSSFMDNP